MLSMLIHKELRLQRTNLLFALLLGLLWAGVAIALNVADNTFHTVSIHGAMALAPTPSLLQFVHHFFLLPMTLVLLPLSIGAHALAPERTIGVWDWQLAQPVSLARQWGIKFVCAVGLALLFAGAMPWALDAIIVSILKKREIASIVYWDSLPHPWRFNSLGPWLYAPTLVGLGAFASALSRNANRAFSAALLLAVFILAAGLIADPAWICFPVFGTYPPKFLHPIAPYSFQILLAAALGVLALPNARLFGLAWKRLIVQLALLAILINIFAWGAIQGEFAGDQFVDMKDKEKIDANYPGFKLLISGANESELAFMPSGKADLLLVSVATPQLMRRIEKLSEQKQRPLRWGIPVEVDVATGDLHPAFDLCGLPEGPYGGSRYISFPSLRFAGLGKLQFLGGPFTRMRGLAATVNDYLHRSPRTTPVIVGADGQPVPSVRKDHAMSIHPAWLPSGQISQDSRIDPSFAVTSIVIPSKTSNRGVCYESLLLLKGTPKDDLTPYTALDRIIEWVNPNETIELEDIGLPPAHDGGRFILTSDQQWHGWDGSYSHLYGGGDYRLHGPDPLKLHHIGDDRVLQIDPDGMVLDCFAAGNYGVIPVSPDGRWLPFARVTIHPQAPNYVSSLHLYLKDTRSGEETKLIELNNLLACSVKWSANGQLAFQANERLYLFRPRSDVEGLEPPRIYRNRFGDLTFFNDRYMIGTLFDKEATRLVRLDLETAPTMTGEEAQSP